MDEVNISAGDMTAAPQAPAEVVTLEQVVTPVADAVLPVLDAADVVPVPELPAPDQSVPLQPVPTEDVVITPIATEPELPTIQVEPTPVSSPSDSLFSNSRELENKNGAAGEEPKVFERVVEKIVEKEVIKEVIKEVPVEKIIEKEVTKEVPVEKVVEKIVYRDAPPLVCPPPTREEREAIYRDFLVELSHEGTARKHALMLEKLDIIMTLFDTKERIMREDVMDVLECSGTTATRLLTELRHEGKVTLHGERGNGASYTKSN